VALNTITLTLILTSSSFKTQRIWNRPILSFTPVLGKEQVVCLIRRTISGRPTRWIVCQPRKKKRVLRLPGRGTNCGGIKY